MSWALPNTSGEIVLVKVGQYDELLDASKESSRKRMIQPLQRADSDIVQRLLNAMQPGTYIRPHRHPMDGASETLVILQGMLGVVVFDREGDIKETIRMSIGDLIDIEPRVWHSMVCLAPNTVVAEFKKGPYDAATDKEFASWSSELDDGFVSTIENLFK